MKIMNSNTAITEMKRGNIKAVSCKEGVDVYVNSESSGALDPLAFAVCTHNKQVQTISDEEWKI